MQIDYVLPDVMAATPSNIFHNLSDADLIGAIALGHGPAMQILFALHSVKTFRFVLRLVCDFSLAEDVVSKAFLDVWRQAGNFQGRSSVPTWVLTLVRRRALTALQALTTGKLDNNNSARTTEVPDGLEQTIERSQGRTRPSRFSMRLSTGHPRSHRPRLLSQTLDRRGRQDHWYFAKSREVTHAIRAGLMA